MKQSAMIIFTAILATMIPGCGEENENTAPEVFKSCKEEIQKQDQAYQPMFEQMYGYFGAFLQAYNDKLALGGVTAATDFETLVKEVYEGTKIDQLDVSNQEFLGKPASVSVTDKKLKHPITQKIWKDWCSNTENIFSWVMVNAKEWSGQEDLTQEKVFEQSLSEFNNSSDEQLIDWSKEGIDLFAAISGLGIEGLPANGLNPDPTVWFEGN